MNKSIVNFKYNLYKGKIYKLIEKLIYEKQTDNIINIIKQIDQIKNSISPDVEILKKKFEKVNKGFIDKEKIKIKNKLLYINSKKIELYNKELEREDKLKDQEAEKKKDDKKKRDKQIKLVKKINSVEYEPLKDKLLVYHDTQIMKKYLKYKMKYLELKEKLGL